MQTEARVGVVVEGGGPRALNSNKQPPIRQQQQHSQIGTVSQLLAGGLAGALSKTCTAPLARLTILFQLLHMIPGLESHKERIGGDVFVHFLGGGMAGITAATTTYPLDLVRTRLAAQTNVLYYRGIGHALQTICREEGVLGLYKGLGATLLGVGPNIALSFSVYESLRSLWQSQRPDDPTVAVSLACGSLSGIASSTELHS
ncbi:unnamed protein product [Linum tenue]|uniref:Uncharacterized protein n=1 Tax=Linum tenue TaxID=586396 RepID=A0AAV0JQH7_9ROSI|nr:unnamed protein product [Linum tenue]